MMFACIVVAIKVEDINFRTEDFCRKINNPKICNLECNFYLIDLIIVAIARNEIFIIKGLKFIFQTHSPIKPIESILEEVKSLDKSIDTEELKRRAVLFLIKAF